MPRDLDFADDISSAGCILVLAVLTLLAFYVGSFVLLLLDQWYRWNLVWVHLDTRIQDAVSILYAPLIWFTFTVLEAWG